MITTSINAPVFALASVLAAAVAAVAVVGNRRHLAHTVERDYAEGHPAGADGVVRGAEGFSLGGTNGRGVLLLHGSGDSPQSLRYLAARLQAHGYTVHAPLLPGHGRSPRAFATADAGEYFEAARNALNALSASFHWTAIIGLSMGGALAAKLAAATTDVRALVLLAPYVITPNQVRTGVRWSWLWKAFVPYVQGGGAMSVHDAVARGASHAYGTFSAGSLKALTATAKAGHDALSKLVVPTLVINSAQDNRIPRSFAERAVLEITAPVESRWVTGCGHVITVDYCKDAVVDLVVDFLARHAD